MKREYRVRWKREGLGRRTRLYQTFAGAENYVEVLETCNPDNLTDETWFGQEIAKIPPIIEGPTIEAREVGEWEDWEDIGQATSGDARGDGR